MTEMIANDPRKFAAADAFGMDMLICKRYIYPIFAAVIAPFIGFVFIVAGPLAGLAYCVWHGIKAIVEHYDRQRLRSRLYSRASARGFAGRRVI